MDDFFEALEKAAYAKRAEGIGTLSPLSSEIPNVRQPTTAPPAHPITPMTSPRPASTPKPTASSPFGNGIKPPTPTRPPAAASPMAAPTSDWTQHLGALGPALAMGAAPMIGQVAGLPGLMAAWNFLGGRGGQDFQTIFGAPPVSAPPPRTPTPPAPRPAPPVSAPTPRPAPAPAPAPASPPPPQGGVPPPPAQGGIVGGWDDDAPAVAPAIPPAPTRPQPRPEPFSLGPVEDAVAGNGIWMAAPEVASRGLQRVAPGMASRMPSGFGADMAVQLGLVGPLTDMADRSEGFGNLPGVGRQSWFGRNVLGLQPQTPLTTRSINDMAQQDFGRSFSHGPGPAPGNSFIAPSEPSLRDPINYPANWIMQRFPYATRPITTGEWTAESLGQFGQAMGNREAVAARAQSQGLMGNPNIPTHPSPYIFEPGSNGAVPQTRSLGSYLGNLWNQSVEQGPHVALGDQLAQGVDNWNEVLTNRHLARQQNPGSYPEETGERFARDVVTNGPAGISNYWNGTAYIPGTRNLHLPAINPARWGEQWAASVPWWLGGDR